MLFSAGLYGVRCEKTSLQYCTNYLVFSHHLLWFPAGLWIGSGSGSECFWVSRIRIHHYIVRIQIRILISTSKISKKIFDIYYFVTSFWLSMKTDTKVPSKSNKQKTLTKNLPSCQLLTKKQDPAGSISQCGTDPRIRIRIRIHTKMSRIYNIGFAPRI